VTGPSSCWNCDNAADEIARLQDEVARLSDQNSRLWGVTVTLANRIQNITIGNARVLDPYEELLDEIGR